MANKDSASELIRARDISGFDRWSLPSFDPDAPEPDAAILPDIHDPSPSGMRPAVRPRR